MSEHVFSDPDRRLIVRLSEDRLSYEPTVGRGWQCRVSDIHWTSSRISSRGIQEVNLHGAGGRVVVTVLHFEGIERFYLALLHQIAERPIFDPVRESIPTQVPLLERMVRLAAETPEAERPWAFFRSAPGGAVAATEASVLISAADGSVQRLPWNELVGIRSRGAVTRFFTTAGHTEVPIPGLESLLAPMLDLRQGEPTGATEFPASDAALGMSYSWELERARADSLLEPGETVQACAFGTGEGNLLPGERTTAAPGAMSALGAVLPGLMGDRVPSRSELFLTDRRLLHLERDPATLALVSRGEVPLERLPRLKQANGVLILGRFELLPDSEPPQMVADFVRRYRALVADRFDPFGAREPAAGPARVTAGRPDPFSPVLENPLDVAE